MSINKIASQTNKGISNSREYVDNKANSFLSPKTAAGISGWLFDVVENESQELSADITDHYTENNKYINDHKVIKPIKIKLSGFKGELVYKGPEGVEGAIQELNNKLEIVDAYLGDFTPGMVQSLQNGLSQAQSVVSGINTGLDRIQNVVGFFEGDDQQPTLQRKAFSELKALFQSTQLLTVNTPWDFYDNMQIESISVVQDEETKDWSKFSVHLKEMRFSEVEVTNYSENLFETRTEMQKEETEDAGVIKGERDSFLFQSAEATGLIE